jgi:very-short-patch-repair endonuclease
MEYEIGLKLQRSGVNYQSQVEIPVTTADFYFPVESRPLIVFVDGHVHLGKTQMLKDEEIRMLLRKHGYRVLELSYDSYSEKKRDELYKEILESLGRIE